MLTIRDSLSWIRLIARISSLVILGLEIAFLIGEGVYPSGVDKWIGFLFFPVGISLGMILAWWKESLGGSITVGCLALFYLIHFIFTQTFPSGLGWITFSLPGFLFLLYWYLRKEIH
jgi:hypothetical protein